MAIRKVRQPPGWHRAYCFRHGEDRGLPGPIKRRPGWRLTRTTWLFRARELMTVKPYPLGYAYTATGLFDHEPVPIVSSAITRGLPGA